MEYVIIGNGTAAVACIEGIREVDPDGEIALISSEKYPAYGRPLISYYLLGKVDKGHLNYRPADFYKKNKVKTMLKRTVEKIDPVSKQVVLDGGEAVKYNKLLVATGSRPFVPPMQGLESVKNKFSFMTLDDAFALEKQLSKDKDVLVIGAGLIGLKCVEGIADRVRHITVVDLADRIMPSVLDIESGKMVQTVLEEKGVEFILNDCAAEFNQNQVTLKSGKKLTFDILVLAVGVRPNTELIKDAGGEVNRGVVINAKCETTLADIYSAGDCAEGYDKTIDGKRVLALLPNAYFQGRCAGLNMAGGVSSFVDGIPMNAIGFFGCHVLTAGVYEGECISRVTPSSLKKLYIKDGKLSGFILINDIERAGIYTAMIREGTPLSSVDSKLLIEKPQLLAFSREVRDSKLTRKV